MAIYLCKKCETYLTKEVELISKGFLIGQNQGYLFKNVENVVCGPPKETNLITGLHLISSVYCVNCETILGFKYERAFESSQKYKEGKFLLELPLLTIKNNKNKL